jgi:hypothetical protein
VLLTRRSVPVAIDVPDRETPTEVDVAAKAGRSAHLRELPRRSDKCLGSAYRFQ